MLTIRDKIPAYGKGTKRSYRFIFVGKTTDTAPIDEYNGEKIVNGSVFIVMDNNETRLYDAEDKVWISFKGSSGSGGDDDFTEEDITIDPADIDDIFANADND